jgi:hypothetical protein
LINKSDSSEPSKRQLQRQKQRAKLKLNNDLATSSTASLPSNYSVANTSENKTK